MDRSQGRAGGIVSGGPAAPSTFTGNKALQIEELLISRWVRLAVAPSTSRNRPR